MQAGVVKQVRTQAVARAKRARAQVALLLPLIAAVVLAYAYRGQLFGLDLPIRIASVVALVILGWAFAMSLGRAIGPVLLKRLEPGTAGTAGFLIRLATLGITVLVALRLAGLKPETLAVGGAITAVILGLAAQQTVGNLIAGTVLLSARPFRVGDRIRVHAGGVAGTVEGTVSSLGLLYTTLANRADRIMVPTTSCWPRPSCRCASRTAWTFAPGSSRTSGRAMWNGCCARRSPWGHARTRRSSSRRSTRASRSTESERPRRAAPTGPSSRTRS
jgi:small conductance mechanosensitive channel